MLIYNNKHYENRRELKKHLGGTNAYNRAFREGKIIFIDNRNIASNEGGQKFQV